MLKKIAFVVCFFFVSIAFTQQDKQFTHYMFDRMSVNPATTDFLVFVAHLFIEINGIELKMHRILL
jgi:hypothetical protein